MRAHRALGIGILGLLLATGAAAEVFMHRDAAGNPVFTDRPVGDGSTPVPLGPVNEMAATPVPVAPVAPAATRPLPLSYRSLTITAPDNDTTIRDNGGNLTVQVTSEPALYPGHRYALQLDGMPAGQAEGAASFALTNLDRGTHQLTAVILDDQGRPVAQSASVAIHVKRISLAQRRQVQPCKLADYGVRLECPLKDKPAKPDIPFVPFI